ncbi:MAG: FHA domain-containing protein [Planctomycetota bacterium]|nr:FHA domain-containing protein [Planctomycetota bacterium]
MAKVAISAEFLVAFSRVPKKVQKKVREFVEKFLHDPTMASINYESIHGMKDKKVRTVRIGLDYRAIVLHPPKGDVYVCVWVDHHDEAMDWAKNKRFEVNPTIGSFQIYEVKEVVEASSVVEHTPPADDLLFSKQSPDDLRHSGVPESLIPSVCRLRTESDLEEMKHYLPAGVGDTLTMLAAGYNVAEALREAISAHSVLKKVDTNDFAAAMSHPLTKRRFKVVEKPEDLHEMLHVPDQITRTFIRGKSDAVFHDKPLADERFPLEVEVNGALLDRQIAPGERWVFGRHATCDVMLEDTRISREQFEVRNIGSQVEIKPFPSKNETQVVGRRAHGEVYYTVPDLRIFVADSQVTLRPANS